MSATLLDIDGHNIPRTGIYQQTGAIVYLSFLSNSDANCSFFGFLEYNPPNPQPGQGIHRFYFFVFQQKEKLVDGIHIANRCGFNIDGFIKDFGLKPVAMNMFRSEFQNAVIISEMIIT